jgi:hypothetical protein
MPNMSHDSHPKLPDSFRRIGRKTFSAEMH